MRGGASTVAEPTGPIRRFPPGFWASFNSWWHAEFGRQGHRPSSKAISKWHDDNAASVWGEHAVSYGEVQRHANRMKQRRLASGGPHPRRGRDDDDDDEEDDYAGEAACRDSASPLDDDSSAQEASIPVVGSLGGPHTRAASRSGHRLDFNTHSDPPGALVGGYGQPLDAPSDPPALRSAAMPAGPAGLAYLGADSDLPCPAAAPSGARLPRGGGGGGEPACPQQPMWIHPDPSVCPPASARGDGGSVMGLSLHDASSMYRLGDYQHSSYSYGLGDGSSYRLPAAGADACQQPHHARQQQAQHGSPVAHERQQQQQQQQLGAARAQRSAHLLPGLARVLKRPRGADASGPVESARAALSNPFAAFAAAAHHELHASAPPPSSNPRMPSARDAAALLRGASLSMAAVDPVRNPPSWLADSCELDALMTELAAQEEEAAAAAAAAAAASPMALSLGGPRAQRHQHQHHYAGGPLGLGARALPQAAERLSLPPPRQRRDPSKLLLRGLRCEGITADAEGMHAMGPVGGEMRRSSGAEGMLGLDYIPLEVLLA